MGISDVGLFEAVVSEAQLNRRFVQIRDEPSYAPARQMMIETFEAWPDADHHFVREFQTHGFDSRTWELYLRAVLLDLGLTVDGVGGRPDFRCRRGASTFFVEATTSNRRADEPFPTTAAEAMQQVADSSNDHDEFAIRLGSALFSKQQKRYHELPRVSGHPLLFALEAFHDQGALFVSGAPLLRYLFGLALVEKIAPGVAVPAAGPLSEHRHGAKVVPSGWFSHSGNEHVSAVLFSNAGTVTKFLRMGIQAAHWHPRLRAVVRHVHEFDPDPNAMVPIVSAEHITVESTELWSEGLVVIHNPHAIHPVDSQLFPGVSQLRQYGDKVALEAADRHIFGQYTMILQTSE